jgi:hypothetical protein
MATTTAATTRATCRPRPHFLLPPFHVARSRGLGPPVLGLVPRGALKAPRVQTTTTPTGRETVESPSPPPHHRTLSRPIGVGGFTVRLLLLSLPPPIPSSLLPSRVGIGLSSPAPVRLGLGLGGLYRCPPACPACKVPPPTPQSIPPGAGSGGGQEGQRNRQRRNQTQTQTRVPLVYKRVLYKRHEYLSDLSIETRVLYKRGC